MFLYYLNLILTMINKLIEGNPPNPHHNLIIIFLYYYLLIMTLIVQFKEPPINPFLPFLLFCNIRILCCLWLMIWEKTTPLPNPTSSSYYYILIFLPSYNDFLWSIQGAPHYLFMSLLESYIAHNSYNNVIIVMII